MHHHCARKGKQTLSFDVGFFGRSLYNTRVKLGFEGNGALRWLILIGFVSSHEGLIPQSAEAFHRLPSTAVLP
jgi:hypothetical protein